MGKRRKRVLKQDAEGKIRPEFFLDDLDDEELSRKYDAIQSRGTQEPEGNQRPFLPRETPATLESERWIAMSHSLPRGLDDAVNRGEISLSEAVFIQQGSPLQRQRLQREWEMDRERKRKKPGPDPLKPLMVSAKSALVAEGNKDISHRLKKKQREALRAYLRDHHGIREIDDSTFLRNGF